MNYAIPTRSDFDPMLIQFNRLNVYKEKGTEEVVPEQMLKRFLMVQYNV